MRVALVLQPSSLERVLVRRRRRQRFWWWRLLINSFGRVLRGRPELVQVLVSYLTSILGATPPARDGGAAPLAIARHLKHGGKRPAEAMRPDDRKEDLRSRLGAPNWPKADLRSRITGVPGPSPTIAKPQGGRGRAGRGGARQERFYERWLPLLSAARPRKRLAAAGPAAGCLENSF